MRQVRITDELAELALQACPDAGSLAAAVETVIIRGLSIEPDASSEVEKPEAPQVSEPDPDRSASVRKPKRGSLWPE